MDLVTLLIGFPFGVGLLLLAASSDRLRSWIAWTAAALLTTGVIALGWRFFPGEAAPLALGARALSWAMLAASAGMAVFIMLVGLRAQRPLIILLLLAQSAILLPLELSHIREAYKLDNLFVDKFSILMAAVIGIAGSLICARAVGCMREFHRRNPEIRDRRRGFFCVLYVLLGAMFGVVFSNNLLWLSFFWQIATLAAYLLIAYKSDDLSQRGALRALTMNLAGGVGIAVGVWIFQQHAPHHSLLLTDLLNPVNAKYAMIPAAAFCFAGMTKSAQHPFSRWLLSSLAAPAPVPALLQSSTLTVAGVYLVVRMAPIMQGTTNGAIVALAGAAAFLTGLLMALAQDEIRKALTYSSIAALGLIVLCGGIGAGMAVRAATCLVVLHAAAQGLLWLSFGLVERETREPGRPDGMRGLFRKLQETPLLRAGNLIAIALLVALFFRSLP